MSIYGRLLGGVRNPNDLLGIPNKGGVYGFRTGEG
jgi:hypothetical protein